MGEADSWSRVGIGSAETKYDRTALDQGVEGLGLWLILIWLPIGGDQAISANIKLRSAQLIFFNSRPQNGGFPIPRWSK